MNIPSAETFAGHSPASGRKRRAPAADALGLLLAELAPARLTTVVDVGANPINPAPYSALLKRGGAHVVGFEPQAEAFAALQAAKGPNETYFPLAVGNGGPLRLQLFASSGLTSIFKPYLAGLKAIGRLGWARRAGEAELTGVALDEVAALPPFDLLKIDIQGAEVMVFQGAERVLRAAVAVIVELRYFRLYEGEPMLGGVDAELRRQGFHLHKFLDFNAKTLVHSQMARVRPRRMQDQLVDGDAVYLRDITAPEALSMDQLTHLAILAAGVFASHSLALFCLDHLAARGAAAADLPARYVARLPKELRND
jgi:FkbM family methyltransferase